MLWLRCNCNSLDNHAMCCDKTCQSPSDVIILSYFYLLTSILICYSSSIMYKINELNKNMTANNKLPLLTTETRENNSKQWCHSWSTMPTPITALWLEALSCSLAVKWTCLFLVVVALQSQSQLWTQNCTILHTCRISRNCEQRLTCTALLPCHWWLQRICPKLCWKFR